MNTRQLQSEKNNGLPLLAQKEIRSADPEDSEPLIKKPLQLKKDIQ